MSRIIYFKIFLIFIGSHSVSAKEKGKVELFPEAHFSCEESQNFAPAHLLSISQEEFNRLPAEIKRRIPDHLTKIDSLLICTDFRSATADENQVTCFSNGELCGTIVKMSGRNYKLMDDRERFLGLFRKSRDGQRYTLVNANGDILFNSQGLSALFYVISVLVSLLVTIFIYSLVYSAFAG